MCMRLVETNCAIRGEKRGIPKYRDPGFYSVNYLNDACGRGYHQNTVSGTRQVPVHVVLLKHI